MSTFDSRAREWDKPDRMEMTSGISDCMLSCLKLNKNMAVLDFGAGTGLITFKIAGFINTLFKKAYTVKRGSAEYPIFLFLAEKP